VKLTVVGIAGKVGGLAIETRTFGRHTYLRGAHISNDIEAGELLDSTIHLDHGTEDFGVVGYIEIGAADFWKAYQRQLRELARRA
jgi:hypothetical protein